ncbi:MAG: type I-E CRISPR-associated protein Cse1/CasA [Acidobacteria bacterium]|nr:type I-E CRISPR-associated protein Cse1/CasA [Acidobacteriota bacterium]
MPEYNLTEECWIPCLMLKDNEARELSLRDCLLQAHDIREVIDHSPLVTVALHRFLLAVIHAALRGPKDFDEWKELWTKRQWDEKTINDYLDKWRHRFELFDKARPFYQVARMKKEASEKKKTKKQESQNAEPEDVELHPIALLAHEAATGNNATLFDHSFNASPKAFTPAESVRYLIARQAFSVGGGVSQPFNLSNATLVNGYAVLAQGNNFFETLALNLLPYTEATPIAWRSNAEDTPVWEHNNLEIPNEKGTQPRGYLDYLTWQSRRIHLVVESDADNGSTLVRRCQLLQNLKLSDASPLFDPFKCYIASADKGYKTKDINPNKALWRDSHALLQQNKDEKKKDKRPEVFNHLAMLESARDQGVVKAEPAYSLIVYGFANDKASVFLWSRERLPLPLSYLCDAELVEILENALGLAEKIAENLKASIKTLAKEISTDQDASKVASSFGAEEFYWSRLEVHFKKLLTDIPNQNREDEYKWARHLESTARDAFAMATNSLSGSARDFKGITKAETEFNKLMGRTRKAFAAMFPQQQTAGGK